MVETDPREAVAETPRKELSAPRMTFLSQPELPVEPPVPRPSEDALGGAGQSAMGSPWLSHGIAIS